MSEPWCSLSAFFSLCPSLFLFSLPFLSSAWSGYILDLLEGRRKLVVFAHHRRMIDAICDSLDRRVCSELTQCSLSLSLPPFLSLSLSPPSLSLLHVHSFIRPSFLCSLLSSYRGIVTFVLMATHFRISGSLTATAFSTTKSAWWLYSPLRLPTQVRCKATNIV